VGSDGWNITVVHMEDMINAYTCGPEMPNGRNHLAVPSTDWRTYSPSVYGISNLASSDLKNFISVKYCYKSIHIFKCVWGEGELVYPQK
jgi:hypothetical protein